MGLVMRETGSGLVLAEQAADEAGLSRALKQLDDRLVLQRHAGDVAGGWVYKVFTIVSDDEPAECVCTGADEYGNPLPLSSGLLDLVQRLRPDARDRRGPTSDERNAAYRAELDHARTVDAERVSDDHRAKIERGSVTVSLTAGRRKPYWMRNHRPPEATTR
jgi:hypothetical protein